MPKRIEEPPKVEVSAQTKADFAKEVFDRLQKKLDKKQARAEWQIQLEEAALRPDPTEPTHKRRHKKAKDKEKKKKKHKSKKHRKEKKEHHKKSKKHHKHRRSDSSGSSSSSSSSSESDGGSGSSDSDNGGRQRAGARGDHSPVERRGLSRPGPRGRDSYRSRSRSRSTSRGQPGHSRSRSRSRGRNGSHDRHRSISRECKAVPGRHNGADMRVGLYRGRSRSFERQKHQAGAQGRRAGHSRSRSPIQHIRHHRRSRSRSHSS